MKLNIYLSFLKHIKKLFYIMTYTNKFYSFSRNETSLVSLKLLEKGKRVQEVIYSHPYTLRADISKPDGKILFLLYYKDSM